MSICKRKILRCAGIFQIILSISFQGSSQAAVLNRSLLSPQSVFNTIIDIDKIEGQYVLTENKAGFIERQKNFREKAEKLYFKLLKERAANIGLSDTGLKNLIKDHFKRLGHGTKTVTESSKRSTVISDLVPVAQLSYTRSEVRELISGDKKPKVLRKIYQDFDSRADAVEQKVIALLSGVPDETVNIGVREKKLLVNNSKKRMEFRKKLKSIFIHAAENAADGYLQAEYEKEPLNLLFYVHRETGQIVISIVNNGVSLQGSESSSQKRNNREKGKERIGGKGLGLKAIKRYAQKIHPEASVNLLERKDLFKDEKDGAVLQIKFPVENPDMYEVFDLWDPIDDLDGKILLNRATGQIRYAGIEPVVSLDIDGVEFYVERHAETYANRGRVTVEHRNDLTPRGERQAELAAKILYEQVMPKIKNGAELLVISSSMKRTLNTAIPFARLTNAEISEMALFDEMALGIFSSAMHNFKGNAARKYLYQFRKRLNAFIAPPKKAGISEEAESFIDTLTRAKAGLSELKKIVAERKASNGGKKVVVVLFTHDIMTKAIMTCLGESAVNDKDLNIINWRKIKVANACPKRFVPAKREFRDLLVEDRDEMFAPELPSEKGSVGAASGIFYSERERGQTFIDTVLLTADDLKRKFERNEIKREDAQLLIGLETGWLPDTKGSPMNTGLTLLLNNLSRMAKERDLNNITKIRANGMEIAEQIAREAERDKTPNSNILFLGRENIFESGRFDTFRGGPDAGRGGNIDTEDQAFFAGIGLPGGMERLPGNSYIRVLEMLTKAMNLWAGKSIEYSTDHLRIIKEGKKLYKFIIPEAEIFNPQELKEIYSGQVKAMMSA